jgi:hypothetical protein
MIKMATKKWTEQTAVTKIDGGDYSMLSTLTGESKKILGSNLLSGWIGDSNTWTYSSADSPSFVASVNADVTGYIGVGMRIRLTQTSVKYFIVTAVGSYGGGATLVTLYGGTDYSLTNAACSLVAWASVKAPVGFPINPEKWTVETSFVTDVTQNTPTAGTWYNITNISLPIGVWKVRFTTIIENSRATAEDVVIYVTLSTGNNSVSDWGFTYYENIFAVTRLIKQCTKEKNITLAAKTVYYLNMATYEGGTAKIVSYSSFIPTTISAVCAYL